MYSGGSRDNQRTILLLKEREKQRKEIEFQKKKLATEMAVGEMSTKFSTNSYDVIEQQLKTDTVGLVTLDEMKARQEAIMAERERKIIFAGQAEERARQAKKAAILKNKGPISFEIGAEEDDDDDEPKIKKAKEAQEKIEDEKREDETSSLPKRRLGKNPNIDTSYVPDIYRDEEEKQLREELRKEWVAKQAQIKEEEITITYSYWDGSGHRRAIKLKKGNTIHLFLQRCVEQLRAEFPELKTATADQLMYVKEDLIIPHHYTFYDFIVTKARGKSGPLFNFDAYEDVRIMSDASKNKDESHAGKVCLRSWYERHKHIFPASRWEPYDPAKKWDQYTISDKMATKINIK
ncbi:Protein fam50a [Cichlidogyrus casuarinus]|uniref:Protein fam50a n=1 Tax=Cichlidogyrus casuarinus TaxID=1844966 RepID=A0ABD2QNT8_9PLAT